MGYSHLNDEVQISAELSRLNKQIEICRKVKDTLESPGWKETIEPLIDRYIIDIVGGKIKDTWVSGKLDRAKTDEKREFYIGVKQGLIDLISRVKFHLTELERLQEQHKQLLTSKQVRFRQPLIDDTTYGEQDAISKKQVKKSL